MSVQSQVESDRISRERLSLNGEPPARHAVNLVEKNQVDTFIVIEADGQVTAHNGHVDLGTGIRTAFAQIVAEELDVGLHQVRMVLGDTRHTPDQGPTTASASIQSAAVPMRRAAAQARQQLLARAMTHFGVTSGSLSVSDGIVRCHDGRTVSYAELAAGQNLK